MGRVQAVLEQALCFSERGSYSVTISKMFCGVCREERWMESSADNQQSGPLAHVHAGKQHRAGMHFPPCTDHCSSFLVWYLLARRMPCLLLSALQRLKLRSTLKGAEQIMSHSHSTVSLGHLWGFNPYALQGCIRKG